MGVQQLRSEWMSPSDPSDPSEQYYTKHDCPECGSEAHGIRGRWACTVCGYIPAPAVDAGRRDHDAGGGYRTG